MGKGGYMNSYKNDDDKKKKGALPFFSRLFNTSSRATGGFAGSAGKAALGGAKGGFFASLFASKAGIVGVVLGAATIAAGIGVIYNYMEPSSSGRVYTPNLFSNAYYEEAQKQANAERGSYSGEAPSASSLDIFKKGAQDELKQNADEKGTDKTADADASANPESASADNSSIPAPSSNPGANAGINGDRRLQSNLGFSEKGGGGGSSQNRLQTSGGMWGGIGKQFAPISKNANMSGAGKTSQMNKALAARVIGSLNILFLM
jgi:hypothetical protein